MKGTLIFIVFAIFLFGCTEEPKTTAVLPSDVKMTIIKSSKTEGRVDVTATALNVNFFTIEFQDGDDSESIEDATGKASHQYTKTGVYTIVVKAHSTLDQFTEISDTVHISISETFDPNGVPTTGYTSPLSYTGYTLVWQDEFDGSSLDSKNWNYEIGTGSDGWGNNESQYYLQENTSVNDGYLTITAKEQIYNGSSYTSSRLTTKGKKFYKYGRVDIRAALPRTQGMWPALWMLGENISTVGWPACGEIDIMELVGGSTGDNSDYKTYGTIHWDQNGERANYGGSKTISGKDFSEKFHVFSIEWDANAIKWFLDGSQFHVADITPTALSEFHEDFFFIFNVAVGGNWPGYPDTTTEFPQKMHVDYIRVFQ